MAERLDALGSRCLLAIENAFEDASCYESLQFTGNALQVGFGEESQMSVRRAAKSLVMARSRAKKVAQFYSMSCDQDRILDVGVSTERSDGPAERNYFLKTFCYRSGKYTGLGIQDVSEMETLFPGKRCVQYSGGRFPFGDKDFDWVFSSAVDDVDGRVSVGAQPLGSDDQRRRSRTLRTCRAT